MNIQNLKTIEDLEKVLENSKLEKQVLLKHSTQCPISSDAYSEFQKFSEKNPNINCHLLYVIEDRPVSNHIEEITDFRHESPQVIFFKDGVAIDHFSHIAITSEKLESSL
jgi:bacillithiol system protein YtxJ